MTLLLAAWLLVDCIATYGVWHFWRSLVPLAPAPSLPPAAILVAIKGVGATTAPFLDSICRQQYPHYRLVFAVEALSDPAVGLIESSRQACAGRLAVDIVVAGPTTRRTQKVHNLLTAIGALQALDRVVVFADADTLLPADWLANLIRPIALGEVSASTGYRWPLPQDRRLATRVGAAADLSITTAARSWRWNVCWGGSCAVERSALDAIDIATVWDRAASDDVTLTRALRAHRYRINAPLRVLVPSPVAHTWPRLFSFARRQHLMVRSYAPQHWLLGGATLCIPAAGAGTALVAIARGSTPAAAALLASIVMLQMRSRLRRRIAAAVLPRDVQAAALDTIRFASWAWPLIHAVHCLAFVSSCVGRRFTWAGVEYRLDGDAVRIGQRS